MSNTSISLRTRLLCSALGLCTFSLHAKAVVINDNYTTDEAVDQDDVNGVGGFVAADGDIKCTGTLINPRTVLFAAHCVNRLNGPVGIDTPYPAAWAFQSDAEAGATAWRDNGHQSVPELLVYNVNNAFWHPDSRVRPVALDYKEADIALATLDTPAANVPSWAMLFAPLPAPETIDPETGTGYHIDIYGYGDFGTGTPGWEYYGDLRRRAAENMLGGLSSLDELIGFVWDEDADLPQPLYFFDFDDPAGRNPFDTNIFLDDALGREGTTAPSDSGGPLILDAANNDGVAEDVLLGVLSGGWNENSGAEPSGYGDYSFYQPLFLYWDWIAEHNPYRYVAAKPGHGDWEDPDHWVSLLDPNYRIVDADGKIVAGIPDSPGAGMLGTVAGFGTLCNEDYTPVYCEDAYDDPQPDGWYTADNLPSPTLENGLPGAVNFVPNNEEPVVTNDYFERYFDVTLSAPGTTTLSSGITIDRLTVAGRADLNIAATGHLTSLIGITQLGRSVRVDGRLSTQGDYLLTAGWLHGNGVIEAPFLTNVAGIIMPGNFEDLSTLTIDGSLVMSSGAYLLISVKDGQSDRLIVSQDVNLGGHVFLVGDIAFGDRFTVLEYGGSRSGEFDSLNEVDARGPISKGVLFADFQYLPGSVDVVVGATSLEELFIVGTAKTDQPSGANADKSRASFARTLDEDREESYEDLEPIYAEVDLMDSVSLSTAFDELSPDDAVVMGQALLTSGDILDARMNARFREIRSDLTGMFANIDTFEAEAETGLPGPEADLEGFAATMGIDKRLSPNALFGAMLSYTSTESTFRDANRQGDIEGLSLGLYGAVDLAADLRIDGHVSYGELDVNTVRTATLGDTSQTVRGDTKAEMIVAGFNLSRSYGLVEGLNFVPSIKAFGARYEIDGYTETGATMALDIASRDLVSAQFAMGGRFDFTLGQDDQIKPSIGLAIVEEFGTRTDTIEAGFAATDGADHITYFGPDRSTNWVEFEAVLDVDFSESITATFGMSQTFNRDDLLQSTLGGALQMSF